MPSDRAQSPTAISPAESPAGGIQRERTLLREGLDTGAVDRRDAAGDEGGQLVQFDLAQEVWSPAELGEREGIGQRKVLAKALKDGRRRRR